VHELTVTSSAPAQSIGLRERKRRATSRTIHFTVLQLAAQRGLEQVTVDEISRAADISPRTFFNYFPSKEAAMVGENPLQVEPHVIEAFVEAGPDIDIVEGLLEVIQTMVLLGTGDRELHQLRREVLRNYPELFVIKVAGMRGFEDVLSEAVERRLVIGGDGRHASDAGEALQARARLTAMVAISTMRHAFARWAEGDDSEPLSQKLTESFSMLRSML
jgi:AcrR family transcriptional regulator